MTLRFIIQNLTNAKSSSISPSPSLSFPSLISSSISPSQSLSISSPGFCLVNLHYTKKKMIDRDSFRQELMIDSSLFAGFDNGYDKLTSSKSSSTFPSPSLSLPSLTSSSIFPSQSLSIESPGTTGVNLHCKEGIKVNSNHSIHY